LVLVVRNRLLALLVIMGTILPCLERPPLVVGGVLLITWLVKAVGLVLVVVQRARQQHLRVVLVFLGRETAVVVRVQLAHLLLRVVVVVGALLVLVVSPERVALVATGHPQLSLVLP
jgi:hypothetical protein